MPTFPEAKSDSEVKKFIVTLILKVPIEIELDISRNQITEFSQLSSQDINYTIDNCEEIPVTDQLSKSDPIGDVLISFSQLKQIVAKTIKNHQVVFSWCKYCLLLITTFSLLSQCLRF